MASHMAAHMAAHMASYMATHMWLLFINFLFFNFCV